MKLKKFTQKDRYGNTTSYEFEGDAKPLDPTALMKAQMEQMNMPAPPPPAPVGGEEFIPGNPMSHPGEPKGEDTVPAWLTPGEFVVNAEAMSIPENAAMVEAINNQGRAMQQGGGVEYARAGKAIKQVAKEYGTEIPAAAVMGADAASFIFNPGWAAAAYSLNPKELGSATMWGPGTPYIDRDHYLHAMKVQDSLANAQYTGLPEVPELEGTIAPGLTFNDGGEVSWQEKLGFGPEQMELVKGFWQDPLNKIPSYEQYAPEVWTKFVQHENDGGYARYAQAVEDAYSPPAVSQLQQDIYNSAQTGMPELVDREMRADPVVVPKYDPSTGEMSLKLGIEGYFDDGGMVPMMPDEALLRQREGYSDEVYLDSMGKPTVGHGHLLPSQYKDQVGAKPFTGQELDDMFSADKAKAQAAAQRNVGPAWDNLNRQQQAALTSMAFQLGPTGQAKFKNMLAAIQAGDNREVARQALTGKKGGKSAWLKQTPKRAMDLAMAFDPDVAAQYKNAGGSVYEDDMSTQTMDIPFDPAMTYEMPNEFDGLSVHPISGNQDALLSSAGPAIIRDDVAGPMSVPGEYGPMTIAPGQPMVPVEEVPPVPEVDYMTNQRGVPTAMDQMIIGNQLDRMKSAPMADDSAPDSHDLDEDLGSAEDYEMHDAGVANAAAQEEAMRAKANLEAKYSEGRATQADVDRLKEAQKNAAAAQERAGKARAAVETRNRDAANSQSKVNKEAEDLLGVPKEAPSQPTTPDSPDFDPLPGNAGTRQPGEMPGDRAEYQKEIHKAASQNSKAVNSAKSFLGEMFGDLFDKKELARMAVMYAGSRLLGYDHGGSLQWAAGQYIDRVDAKNAQFTQLAMSGKYDPASIKKYKETGDITTLTPVGQAPTVTGNTMQRSIGGKKTVFQEVKVGDNTMYVGPDGRQYTAAQLEQATQPYEPSFEKGTPEYRERRNRARTNSQARFEEVWKAEDRFRVGDNEWKTTTKIRPKQAADEFWSWSESMGLDPESDEALQIMTNAYQQAIADGKTGDVTPTSLKPYLENQYIREKTGSPDLFIVGETKPGETPKYVRGDKMQALNRNIEYVATRMPALQGLAPQDAASRFYDIAVQEWNALSPEQRELNKNSAGPGESGFYFYINQRANDLLTKSQ